MSSCLREKFVVVAVGLVNSPVSPEMLADGEACPPGSSIGLAIEHPFDTGSFVQILEVRFGFCFRL